MPRRSQPTHTRNDYVDYCHEAGDEENKILLAPSMTESRMPSIELLSSSNLIALTTLPTTTTTTTTCATVSLNNGITVYRRNLLKITFWQVAVAVTIGWCAVTFFISTASYEQQQKLQLKVQVQLNTTSIDSHNHTVTSHTLRFPTFHGESLSSSSSSSAPTKAISRENTTVRSKNNSGNFWISNSIKKALGFLWFSISIPNGDKPSDVGEEENFAELTFDQVANEAKSNAPGMLTRIGPARLVNVCEDVWSGNKFCPFMKQARAKYASSTADASNTTSPIIMYMEFNSDEIFQTPPGTGIYLTALYGVRLAARVVGGVDVIINCTDAHNEASKREYIMPWISGFFPESTQRFAMKGSIGSEQACAPYRDLPIGYMLDDIKFDLRRMAIALVGIPHAKHPAQKWAEKHLWRSKNSGSFANVTMQISNPKPNDKHLIPDIDIDDAVIHFRCGDVMGISTGYFGFMPFYDMARHISKEARSIGIVTQPFDASGRQTRFDDVPQGDRCRIVVTALVAYLQKRHPSARISVHNNANESVALTFARMIMANQTVAGVSSFGVFPATSTFGTGYIQQPQSLGDTVVNHGVLNNPPINRFADNIVVFDPISAITAHQAVQLWRRDPSGKVLLDWFENGRDVPELSFEEDSNEAKSKAPAVITRIGSEQMDSVCVDVWGGQIICPLMEQERANYVSTASNTNPIVMYMEFNSAEIFRSPMGTGNYLTSLYAVRMAARVIGVDVIINCTDAEASKRDYILPWISGFFPESTQRSAMKDNIGPEQACATYSELPVGYMLDDIKYDLRRMAIAMLGIPHSTHPAQQWAEEHLWRNQNRNHHPGRTRTYENGGSFAKVRMQLSNPQPNDKPLFPNIEIDDAVIHFRCGDVMAYPSSNFGFMPFYDMARHISTEARSIGILTQPFDASGQQARSDDVRQGDRCRKVVTALVAYLQKRHPGARISVHNHANESISLTFARMIMANQTVAGVSSFSVYPTTSTFGTGYVQQPKSLGDTVVNCGFLNNPPINRFADNVVVFDPISAITSNQTIQMWDQDPSGKVILDWFENADAQQT